MTGPKARGTGVIDRQTFRCYENTITGDCVVGGILAFHSTDGFPYDIVLDIFREVRAEGRTIMLQPYDLMYEMCALGLYDIGMEIGEKTYKTDWPHVYARMTEWAAYHWTVSRNEYVANQPFDSNEIWGSMLVSMREELRVYLKKARGLREKRDKNAHYHITIT